MISEENAAFINSQTACALIEMQGMVAANTLREDQGHTIAYDESAFLKLIEKYGIHHNAVLNRLS
jgi:hypothetical protein